MKPQQIYRAKQRLMDDIKNNPNTCYCKELIGKEADIDGNDEGVCKRCGKYSYQSILIA